MSSLIIVKPLSPGLSPASAGDSNVARILTPDPKEAFFVPASTPTSIFLDYGQPVTIDSVLLGYHNAFGSQVWSFCTLDGPGGSGGNINGVLVNAYGFPSFARSEPAHSFVKAAAPLTSRYWALFTAPNGDTSAFHIGVLATGLAFQPKYGNEYGAGRPIDDTGTVERLFGGGFAIDEGVATSGYQWTFGDLQPDEITQLYRLAKERRTTRSILVVEDPDQTEGLNDRIHWGLFQKLEPYERLNPLDTKWALKVWDWA